MSVNKAKCPHQGTDLSQPDPERERSRYVIDKRHPIGGEMSEIILGLARRLRVPELSKRHSSTTVLAVFSFVNGLISIALMAIAALVTRAPFIFPSLGPTAFLLFYTPTAPPACPRNTLCGHLIGALAGWRA